MQSYLNGRNAAGNPRVPQSAPSVPPLAKVMATPRSAPHPDHGAPEVECVKQGNRVTRIIVTCGCGERIEIDCVYPDAV